MCKYTRFSDREGLFLHPWSSSHAGKKKTKHNKMSNNPQRWSLEPHHLTSHNGKQLYSPVIFQLKPSSNHRPHHYNSDINPHKKYQTDKSQIVHRIHLLILLIWYMVCSRRTGICHMWHVNICHHAQRPRGRLMIFDIPMLVQQYIDGSISVVWLSYVMSCHNIC